LSTHILVRKNFNGFTVFDVPKSENGIGFSELAVAFEIFHIFGEKCKNPRILTLVFLLLQV